MSYCLDPACPQPANPDNAPLCQGCGQPLRLVDRYRAAEPLGQGGFGRTFLAIDEHRPSRPRCVIKQLAIAADSERDRQKAAELFCREAAQLERLGRHPQIPELLAHFEDRGRLYLVQSWIDGRTLSQERDALGPAAVGSVVVLLREVLGILAFIHGEGVIHRDIKPSNLMRRRDGCLMLIDFGIAKSLVPDAPLVTGTVVGSPEYVAPEQLLGKAIPASDLYSLGVTAINLLTGRSPFDLYDSGRDRWIWRDWLPPGIVADDRLSAVLDRAIARATRERFPTADAMRAALDEACPAEYDRSAAAPNPDAAPLPGSSRRDLPTISSLSLTPYRQPPRSPSVPGNSPSGNSPSGNSPSGKSSSGKSSSGKPPAGSSEPSRRRPDRSARNAPSQPPPAPARSNPPQSDARTSRPGKLPTAQASPARSTTAPGDRPAAPKTRPWWRWLPLESVPAPLCEAGEVAAPPLDLRLLERALASQRWERADEETGRLLREAAGCPQSRRIAPDDLAGVAPAALRALDRLWAAYSGDRFGFGIQSRILASEPVGGDYGKFCNCVGWPTARPHRGRDPLDYRASAPAGHLPSRAWVGGTQWWRHAAAVADRLAAKS